MSACVGVAADREDIAVCPGETVTLCLSGVRWVTYKPYKRVLVIKSMVTVLVFRSTRGLIKLPFYAPPLYKCEERILLSPSLESSVRVDQLSSTLNDIQGVLYWGFLLISAEVIRLLLESGKTRGILYEDLFNFMTAWVGDVNVVAFLNQVCQYASGCYCSID